MIIIDLQGFEAPHFVPKEMAITDGERTAHYVFKPPCPFHELTLSQQTTVNWLTRYHHGLRWSFGNTDLREIEKILSVVTSRDSTIYCKGKIKSDYLRNHTTLPVIDLDDRMSEEEFLEKMAPLRHWKPPCFSHILNYCRCAINNVNQIYYALSQNDKLIKQTE